MFCPPNVLPPPEMLAWYGGAKLSEVCGTFAGFFVESFPNLVVGFEEDVFARCERGIIHQNPARARLNGATDQHLRRILMHAVVSRVLKQFADRESRLSVDHKSERALFVMQGEQHHRAVEVRVTERRRRDEKTGRETLEHR